jgi:CHAT domain-containing protein
MRKGWRCLYQWWIAAVSVLALSIPSTAGAQEGDLAEAQRLNAQVLEYYAAGQYQQAIPLAQRALAITEKAGGPEHPDTATALNNLAALYDATGAYAEAEPLYQRALEITEKTLGCDHPSTAIALNNLAELYRVIGAYAEAEPLYQRALAITEKAFGSSHPGTATALNNLAALYLATSAYAKAEPLYVRALAIRENTLGPEHPDTAVSLGGLALLYRTTGFYAKAEPLYLRAIAITEKALGPEHPYTATALNNLATLYDATGAYAKTEPLYQRVLAITEKVLGPEHPSTAIALNNLAELYRVTGAYAKAEPLYLRTLAIIEKVLGPDHSNTATVLNNLAMLYSATGAYTKAEPLYQHALAVTEKALGPDHPETAISLNNLAFLYRTTGAYAQAEPLYRRALAIYEKTLGPEHPDTPNFLNNLAELYRATGAFAKAESFYQRALAIREKVLDPEHPDTADSLNNLAALYQSTGDYTKSEPLYQRALAIREKVLGPEHPSTATALNNLAALYRVTGAYAKAERFYQRALLIIEKALGPEHPETASSLNNLATLYQNIGSYEKAEPLYQRALAITEKALAPDDPYTAIWLSNLAALYQSTDAYAKAEPLNRRAQDIMEINTARFLLSGDEARKRAYLQQRIGYAHADASFSLAAADPSARALGITAVLRYKGRVLDAMAGSVALLRRSIDPKDQTIFDELAAVAQQLSALTFRGPGNLSVQAYRERADTLAREQERLEGELSARSAAFRQAVAPVTLGGVRQGLPADWVLIEWFRYQPFDPKATDEKTRWGASRYVAYVLRREGDPAAIDVGAARDIDRLVGRFRAAVSDPSRNAFYKEAAQDLFAKLIEPLRSSLSGINRLLLSPDGALNLVPFAALMDEHGEYVAQRFELTYLTSGRDLLSLAAPAPARGRPAVMADPDYGQSASGPPLDISSYRSGDLDRSGLVFTPLAGTAVEARALQELLKLNAEEVLTGTDATEERVKALHGPRILHVATHGFFLSDQQMTAAALRPVSFSTGALPHLPMGENPLLRSGLALAGANARRSGDSDDGILTAAEAAQLDLRGTELVVLSACETGLGQVDEEGEGVYGLRRALVLAGAQAQLVSLWKVADAQTQALMVDYYRRLIKGEGRAAALREAQKAMIANPATRHPYYWAAFVPIGDWTPLAANGSIRPQ